MSGGDEYREESLTQQIMSAAMMDVLISVSLIIGGCLVVHFFILLGWQCCANRKYYSWQMPACPSFSVKVIKAAGAPAGLELGCRPFPFGDGKIFIARVDESSPLMSSKDAPVQGDRVLLINGKEPKNVLEAACNIRDAQTLYMLVQPGSPKGKRLKNCKQHVRVTPGHPGGPRANTKDVAHAGGNGRLGADTKGDGFWRIESNKLPKAMQSKHKALQAKLGERRPSFTSLPEPFCWPNFEVTLFAAFSTGIVQASSGVLGTAIAGHATLPRNLAISIGTIILVLLAYAHEAHRLYLFYENHKNVCWQPSEKPRTKDEVDDPLLAALSNVVKLPPMAREQGSFEAPEDDDEEPSRTERRLERVLTPWRAPDFRDMPPGDALTEVRRDSTMSEWPMAADMY